MCVVNEKRRNLGSHHALDYAASRVAPAALFAVEAGATRLRAKEVFPMHHRAESHGV